MHAITDASSFAGRNLVEALGMKCRASVENLGNYQHSVRGSECYDSTRELAFRDAGGFQ